MKKFIKITAALTSVLVFTAMTGIPVSAQSSQKAADDKKVIPSEVMKVAEKSCAKCHMAPATGMTIGALNLSGWDKYSTAKQAAKAKAMCNAVSSSSMPPKNFIKNNPAAAPTQDDIKTVCYWSATLVPEKK